MKKYLLLIQFVVSIVGLVKMQGALGAKPDNHEEV